MTLKQKYFMKIAPNAFGVGFIVGAAIPALLFVVAMALPQVANSDWWLTGRGVCASLGAAAILALIVGVVSGLVHEGYCMEHIARVGDYCVPRDEYGSELHGQMVLLREKKGGTGIEVEGRCFLGKKGVHPIYLPCGNPFSVEVELVGQGLGPVKVTLVCYLKDASGGGLTCGFDPGELWRLVVPSGQYVVVHYLAELFRTAVTADPGGVTALDSSEEQSLLAFADSVGKAIKAAHLPWLWWFLTAISRIQMKMDGPAGEEVYAEGTA